MKSWQQMSKEERNKLILAVLGGLFVSKFSAVIILPVMGLLAMVRIIDGRPLPALSRRPFSRVPTRTIPSSRPARRA